MPRRAFPSPCRPTTHSNKPTQDFDSGSLAKLAFGLASVGYDDVNLYSAITQAAADVLDALQPDDVAKILWACGEQGHLCDRFMSGGLVGVGLVVGVGRERLESSSAGGKGRERESQ